MMASQTKFVPRLLDIVRQQMEHLQLNFSKPSPPQ